MLPEENKSNYNKRQFWSYKRLNELKNTKKEKDKKDKDNKTTKKTKKIFHIINNKVVTDKTIIERLDKLYIPPAYKDLVVAKSDTNKIQVIGTDTRGRRQYIYNPSYTKKEIVVNMMMLWTWVNLS